MPYGSLTRIGYLVHTQGGALTFTAGIALCDSIISGMDVYAAIATDDRGSKTVMESGDHERRYMCGGRVAYAILSESAENVGLLELWML